MPDTLTPPQPQPQPQPQAASSVPTWDEISGDPSFQGLPQNQKLVALDRYRDLVTKQAVGLNGGQKLSSDDANSISDWYVKTKSDLGGDTHNLAENAGMTAARGVGDAVMDMFRAPAQLEQLFTPKTDTGEHTTANLDIGKLTPDQVQAERDQLSSRLDLLQSQLAKIPTPTPGKVNLKDETQISQLRNQINQAQTRLKDINQFAETGKAPAINPDYQRLTESQDEMTKEKAGYDEALKGDPGFQNSLVGKVEYGISNMLPSLAVAPAGGGAMTLALAGQIFSGSYDANMAKMAPDIKAGKISVADAQDKAEESASMSLAGLPFQVLAERVSLGLIPEIGQQLSTKTVGNVIKETLLGSARSGVTMAGANTAQSAIDVAAQRMSGVDKNAALNVGQTLEEAGVGALTGALIHAPVGLVKGLIHRSVVNDYVKGASQTINERFNDLVARNGGAPLDPEHEAQIKQHMAENMAHGDPGLASAIVKHMGVVDAAQKTEQAAQAAEQNGQQPVADELRREAQDARDNPDISTVKLLPEGRVSPEGEKAVTSEKEPQAVKELNDILGPEESRAPYKTEETQNENEENQNAGERSRANEQLEETQRGGQPPAGEIQSRGERAQGTGTNRQEGQSQRVNPFTGETEKVEPGAIGAPEETPKGAGHNAGEPGGREEAPVSTQPGSTSEHPLTVENFYKNNDPEGLRDALQKGHTIHLTEEQVDDEGLMDWAYKKFEPVFHKDGTATLRIDPAGEYRQPEAAVEPEPAPAPAQQKEFRGTQKVNLPELKEGWADENILNKPAHPQEQSMLRQANQVFDELYPQLEQKLSGYPRDILAPEDVVDAARMQLWKDIRSNPDKIRPEDIQGLAYSKVFGGDHAVGALQKALAYAERRENAGVMPDRPLDLDQPMGEEGTTLHEGVAGPEGAPGGENILDLTEHVSNLGDAVNKFRDNELHSEDERKAFDAILEAHMDPDAVPRSVDRNLSDDIYDRFYGYIEALSRSTPEGVHGANSETTERVSGGHGNADRPGNGSNASPPEGVQRNGESEHVGRGSGEHPNVNAKPAAVAGEHPAQANAHQPANRGNNKSAKGNGVEVPADQRGGVGHPAATEGAGVQHEGGRVEPGKQTQSGNGRGVRPEPIPGPTGRAERTGAERAEPVQPGAVGGHAENTPTENGSVGAEPGGGQGPNGAERGRYLAQRDQARDLVLNNPDVFGAPDSRNSMAQRLIDMLAKTTPEEMPEILRRLKKEIENERRTNTQPAKPGTAANPFEQNKPATLGRAGNDGPERGASGVAETPRVSQPTGNEPVQRPGAGTGSGEGNQVPRPVSRPLPTTRPGLRVVDEEHIPTPSKDWVPAGKYDIDEEQRQAVNLILDRTLGKKQKGFMLADGTGVGKTRTLLASALEMRKANPDKPVLIATKDEKLTLGLARELEKMGLFKTRDSAGTPFQLKDIYKALDQAGIEIGTYKNLSNGKRSKESGNASFGKGDYSAAIYDEAHNLKNEGKTYEAFKAVKSDHIVFSTATPFDGYAGSEYFLPTLTGHPVEILRALLGYEQRYTNQLDKNGDPILERVPTYGNDHDSIQQHTLDLRRQLIKDGGMLRRYYPFFGSIDKVPLPDSILDNDHYRAALQAYDAAQYKQRGPLILQIGALTEQHKVPYVVEMVKQELAQGKNVIVVGESVNPQTMWFVNGQSPAAGGELPYPRGFLTELQQRLNAEGIHDIALLHSDSGARPEGEVNKFQNGTARVMLMTPTSGGVGIDLDDQIGDRPRTMILSSPGYAGDVFDQMLGRVSRRNSMTPADVKVLISPSISDQSRLNVLDNKMRALQLIQGGADADKINLKNKSEEPSNGQPVRQRRMEAPSTPRLSLEDLEPEGTTTRAGNISRALGLHNSTADAVLDRVLDHPSISPEFKGVAGLLKQFSNRLSNVDFRLSRLNGKAYYHQNGIHVSPEMLEGKNAAGTLVHEMAHAVTQDVLEHPVGPREEEFQNAVLNIKAKLMSGLPDDVRGAIYSELFPRFDQYVATGRFDDAGLSDIARENTRLAYALYNEHELVASFFDSPKTRGLLDKNNLTPEFKQALTNLGGDKLAAALELPGTEYPPGIDYPGRAPDVKLTPDHTIDPESQKRAMRYMLHKGNITDALKAVALRSSDPKFRALAQHLLPLFDHEGVKVDMRNLVTTGGTYDMDGDNITLNPVQSDKGLEHAILHEAAHAALSLKYEAFERGHMDQLTPDQVAAIVHLDALRREALLRAPGEVQRLENLNPAQKAQAYRRMMQDRPDLRPFYGLKDGHEFIAEAMSNPKFRDFLEQENAGNRKGFVGFARNLWERARQLFRRLLGVGDKQSLLHQALGEIGTLSQGRRVPMAESELDGRDTRTEMQRDMAKQVKYLLTRAHGEKFASIDAAPADRQVEWMKDWRAEHPWNDPATRESRQPLADSTPSVKPSPFFEHSAGLTALHEIARQTGVGLDDHESLGRSLDDALNNGRINHDTYAGAHQEMDRQVNDLLELPLMRPEKEEKVKGILRGFTSEGNLPQSAFWETVEGRNARKGMEQLSAFFAKDFKGAVQKEFGTKYDALPVSTKGMVNDVLNGTRSLSDLNRRPETQKAVIRMRGMIDQLSNRLVNEGLVSEKLAKTIRSNLGKYMTRSYRITDEPGYINYINQAEPQLKIRAENAMLGVMRQQWAERKAEQYLERQGIDQKDPRYASLHATWSQNFRPAADAKISADMARQRLADMAEFLGTDRQGGYQGEGPKKDLSIFMKRASDKELPPDIRNYLGEYTDPLVNYDRTIAKMSHFYATQRMLMHMREKGLAEGWLKKRTDPDRYKTGHTDQVLKNSSVYSPLGGLYSTPRIAKAFDELNRRYQTGTFGKILDRLNGISKVSHVVLSTSTWMRDAFAHFYTGLANGYMFDTKPEHYQAAFKAIAAHFGLDNSTEGRAMAVLGARYGLIDSSVAGGQLRDALAGVRSMNSPLDWLDVLDKYAGKNGLIGKTQQLAKLAGQIKYSSDSWAKMAFFLTEADRLKAENPGWGQKEIYDEAGKRIAQNMMNYHMQSAAIRNYKNGLLGPFVGFWAETLRANANNFKSAIRDMRAPAGSEQFKHGLMRASGYLMAMSLPIAINAASRMAVGMSQQDEDNFRSLLPDYEKNRSLMFYRNSDGKVGYNNMTYSTPWTQITDPINTFIRALQQGENPLQAAGEGAAEFIRPADEETMSAQTILGALHNQDQYGRPIVGSVRPLDNAKSIFNYVMQNFVGGSIYRGAYKVLPSILGQKTMQGGFQLNPNETLMHEALGLDPKTVDLAERFRTVAKGFRDQIHQAEEGFVSPMYRHGVNLSPGDIQDAHAGMEENRYAAFKTIYGQVQAALKSGVPLEDVEQTLKETVGDKRIISSLLGGYYSPYQPSKGFYRKTQEAGHEVPDDLFSGEQKSL